MSIGRITYCLFLFITLNLNSFAQGVSKSWTDYRGPHGNGHSTAVNIPIAWSDSTNVAWKTSIPGKGWSSPVVLDNKVWITSALGEERELYLLGIDQQSGEILHNILLFVCDSLQETHPLNSHASPSAVVERGRVFAHFGAYGTACVNARSGEVIWKRDDFYCHHDVGPGSSPFIYNDLLILTYDGTDVRFLVALDKVSGEIIWRTDRDITFGDMAPGNQKAFSTPIIHNINGADQLISVGPHCVMGYGPKTGKQLWKALFKGFSTSTRPVVDENNTMYFNTGFGPSAIAALQLGGEGEITDSIKWTNKKGTQARSSALLVDDLLFMVNTGGQAKCFVAQTGEELWTERVGKQTSASPIYVEGKIYTFDEEGRTVVFKPGREFQKIGENFLSDGFMASPAVVDNALFLRTKTHLYRIQD